MGELFLNGTLALINLDLATCLLFDFMLLSLWVLVRVLHAKLGDEDFDVEIVTNLLAIE